MKSEVVHNTIGGECGKAHANHTHAELAGGLPSVTRLGRCN